jgi:hypothetical protein
LAELVNIRFKANESASGFCLRLREVFEDLEMVPGPSSIHMNDTQKIGYLLSGIRQEKQLQAVYVALQDKQVRGAITFEEACEDLHHRCEAIRADELLNTPIRGQTQKALISTHGKKHNKRKDDSNSEVELAVCLEKDCSEMIKTYIPLCGLHYHQCVSGKCPKVVLKENYGIAKFNSKTQKIDYPSVVPKARFPLPVSARPRKGLMFSPQKYCGEEVQPSGDLLFSQAQGHELELSSSPEQSQIPPHRPLDPSLRINSGPLPLNQGEGLNGQRRVPSNGGIFTPSSGEYFGRRESRRVQGEGDIPGFLEGMAAFIVPSPKLLAMKSSNTASTFYVDSGAGQSLSSCSTAFLSLEPCHIEVIGVAGSLTIFRIGTAVFALALEGGMEILIRIHNCLYSFGEFNLLSVSQMQTILSSVLDLTLQSPSIRLYSNDENDQNREHVKFVDIPLVIDDSLYALTMTPVSSDDPRHVTSQIFDITSAGEYFPLSQTPVSRPIRASHQMWTARTVSASQSKGRIFTLAGALDFHSELRSFSDQYLAPTALPPSRKQFNVTDPQDMSDLSIRFLGVGTDRILHTVGNSNGLLKSPSKKHARVPLLNFPQGNMKDFKTPRVSKDIVGHVLSAGIAEAVYTDTFYTGDHKFPYAQAFVDRVSRYGDVIPLRSRTEVGAALVTFVCRHFTPLVLISDNIAENHGGDLVAQCRLRDIKQLYTYPTTRKWILLRDISAGSRRWPRSQWFSRELFCSCGCGQ